MAAHYRTALAAERGIPQSTSAPQFKEDVSAFRAILPIFGDLRSPALKSRHWAEIHTLVGIHISGTPEPPTIGTLVSAGIGAHVHNIARIAAEALQQAALEASLAKVEALWAENELSTLPYKDSKSAFVLGELRAHESFLSALSVVTCEAQAAQRTCGRNWMTHWLLFRRFWDRATLAREWG